MVRLTVDNYVSKHSPGRLLRSVHRQMLAFAEARFAEAELSFIQWIALNVVQDGTIRTAGELARDLRMTSGAATRLIDALERREFLRRDRQSADRRVVLLVITAAGSARILKMAPTLTAAWNVVLAGFDEAEFAGLTDGLVKLLAAFEAQEGLIEEEADTFGAVPS